MTPDKKPDPFIQIRIQTTDQVPNLLGACAGYEAGKWRCSQLVTHLIEWLPEFALNYSDYIALGGHNATAKVIQAAKRIYTTELSDKRGELGELLLHALIRQTFDTYPAISKIFYKDSNNDTVKGFDAVHVVATQDRLELWLGESKFYDDITTAIADVTEEMQDHTQHDYLRDEFTAITNKIDPAWPVAQRLINLLNKNTSLDIIFDAVVIPVLLTYDSGIIAYHHEVSEQFVAEFITEVSAHRQTFSEMVLPDLRIELFLFPLESKQALVATFDERLKQWQSLG